MAEIYVDNSMNIVVPDLRDEDNNLVSGATVEATVYESDGATTVGGVSWPITLSEDSSGYYSGTLPHDAEIVAHKRYLVSITATQGSAQAKWKQRYLAVERD